MWATGEPTEHGYYWVDTTDPSGFVAGEKAPALWHDRWEIAGMAGGTPVFRYHTAAITAPPEHPITPGNDRRKKGKEED